MNMRILTIATQNEGYFNVLKQTAEDWGYDLQVLGWGKPWKGLAWKIELYIEKLKTLPKDETVICVDGYDVVVIGPSEEVSDKFKALNHPVIFSGQRYFPNQRWIQKLADQLMSNSRSRTIGNKHDSADYSRPCMGLLIGCVGSLLSIFKQFMEIEQREAIKNDQILLNIFYLQHPEVIKTDSTCALFQNLWRTRGGLYGKISVYDRTCEVEIYHDATYARKRIRNIRYKTTPCFLHAPFNLDMGLILNEIGIDSPKLDLKKGFHYWQYTLLYFINRGLKFYGKTILVLLLITIIIILMIIFIL